MKEFKLTDLIEKYRFVIGGGLLVLILVGSGILLYRENSSKPDYESRISDLENKIDELETAKQTPSVTEQKPVENTLVAQEQAPVASATTETAKQSSPKISGKINLNTAGASQLDSLPGIGTTYAQRIIDYRTANGSFKTIEEIKNVKGIGDKTFEKFKDQISI